MLPRQPDGLCSWPAAAATTRGRRRRDLHQAECSSSSPQHQGMTAGGRHSEPERGEAVFPALGRESRKVVCEVWVCVFGWDGWATVKDCGWKLVGRY